MHSLAITGMSCGHCVDAVKRALAAVPGVEVEHVEVGSATVKFDAARTDVALLTRAVEDAGFAVASVT